MSLFGLGKPNIEKMKAKRNVAGLIKVLRNKKDERLHSSAVWALEEIGDKQAVDELVFVLRDAHRDYEGILRERAAQALGKIGDSRAVDGLAATLKDYEGYVSKSAAIALGKIGDPSAINGLIGALYDEYVALDTRGAVGGALAKIGGDRVVKALTDALIIPLNEHDLQAMRNVVEELGQIGNQSATEALLAAVSKGECIPIRSAATEALGKIGSKNGSADVVDGLVLALRDPEWSVRNAAKKGLDRINSPSAVNGLRVYKETTKNEIQKGYLYFEVGVLFDIDALGGGYYGAKAWTILLQHLTGTSLADATLLEGDTQETINGRARQFCIVVRTREESQACYVKIVMSQANDIGLLPLNERFLMGAVTDDNGGDQQLTFRMKIDASGRFVPREYTRVDEELCEKTGWVYWRAPLTKTSDYSDHVSRDVCGKCGRTRNSILNDLAEAKRRGMFIYGEGSDVLLYCDNCRKSFCGSCQIDLGMSSGCPKCRKALD